MGRDAAAGEESMHEPVVVRVSRAVVVLSLALACSGDQPLNPAGRDLAQAPISPNGVAVDGVPNAIGQATSATAFTLRVGQTVVWAHAARQLGRFTQYTSSAPDVAPVSADGRVEAIAPGEAQLSRRFAGQVEHAAVTVLPLEEQDHEIATLDLRPKRAQALHPGASRAYTVTALDRTGATVSAPVTLSAAGGYISPMGTFTAGPATGAFLVIATCACGLADTAIVDIVPAVQVARLVELKVTPRTGTAAPGGTVQFSATVRWNNGSTAVPPLRFTTPDGGNADPTGRFVAPSAAGTYRVVVAPDSGTIRDTAVVTVAAVAPPPPAPQAPPPPAPPPTPNGAAFGPGPNAPQWARASGARVELFDAPLPINGQPTMAAGWRGSVGFPGYVTKGREVVYTPGPRVTYPVVQTPLGVKSVFQFIFPGSSRIISAAGQTTVPWPTDQNAGVRVSGTWKGTLAFEWSADNGSTWEPVTLKGEAKDVSTGVSTTGNGIWSLINPISGGRMMQWGNEGKLLRVRAASWTSGSATVAVGMKGGEEPVYASAGGFSNGRKGYIRFLAWMDADYSAEGVPEVKGFYVNTSAGVAHILGFVGRPDAQPSNDGFSQLWLQMNHSWSKKRFNGSRGPANGQWLDVELLFEMNDADKANGVARGWINGVQQMNATDVPWVPIGTEGTFRSVTLVPVHGGGKAPPPRTNTIQIAAWYLHSEP